MQKECLWGSRQKAAWLPCVHAWQLECSWGHTNNSPIILPTVRSQAGVYGENVRLTETVSHIHKNTKLNIGLMLIYNLFLRLFFFNCPSQSWPEFYSTGVIVGGVEWEIPTKTREGKQSSQVQQTRAKATQYKSWMPRKFVAMHHCPELSLYGLIF